MGGFGHLLGAFVGALFGLFALLVVVGLVFLLVRFLLVATKAAHIYVAKNSPAAPARPATVTPTTVAAPAAKSAVVTKPAAAKPAATPRTPKPPTA
jgi:predicted lipid-binding transport protein (Tim44 family)